MTQEKIPDKTIKNKFNFEKQKIKCSQYSGLILRRRSEEINNVRFNVIILLTQTDI